MLSNPFVERLDHFWGHFALPFAPSAFAHKFPVSWYQIKVAVDFNNCLVIDRRVVFHRFEAEMLAKRFHLLFG